MSNITIIGPSQLSRSPRLARSAYAASLGGHNVTVITPTYEPDFSDDDLNLQAIYHLQLCSLAVTGKNGVVYPSIRLTRKASLMLGGFPIIHRLTCKSLYYKPRNFFKSIVHSCPDVIIGHQHSIFGLAVSAARRLHVPCILDVEDILSAEPNGLQRANQYIEKHFLPQASYVTTMSQAASAYLRITCNLNHSPTVIYNSHEVAAGNVMDGGLALKLPCNRPSIYWMGKTIGPHSCAEEILHACIEIGMPFDIHLRGNPLPRYTDRLISMAVSAGFSDRLRILPSISKNALLEEAKNHDVLLGSQPPGDFFHELAVGNKVCLGASAGCALLLQDTLAHRSLPIEALQAACFFDISNPQSIKDALLSLSRSPVHLASLKSFSKLAGSSSLGWRSQMIKIQSLLVPSKT